MDRTGSGIPSLVAGPSAVFDEPLARSSAIATMTEHCRRCPATSLHSDTGHVAWHVAATHMSLGCRLRYPQGMRTREYRKGRRVRQSRPGPPRSTPRTSGGWSRLTPPTPDLAAVVRRRRGYRLHRELAFEQPQHSFAFSVLSLVDD